MARPKKERNICQRTPYDCFKPNGVPLSQLDKVELLDEELEALRLADLEDLSQSEAAASMGNLGRRLATSSSALDRKSLKV